ncbi:Malate:quinone oxidoreductase [Tatumella ptyseos]|uniref:malate dehydrogenase (quinone) n=1 Tax=Tatumella ptyseos TaxID=82987 RepID=A0A2X5RFQ2_9GAMM|nr:Malate:quinone oxidoreductase [Tatumella ptyseos]
MCRSTMNLSLAMSSIATTEQKVQQGKDVDVLLIGAGVMSATLGTFLQELEPEWTLEMVERLSGVAEESSNGWNNAGTGHSALAELNYTRRKPMALLISVKRSPSMNLFRFHASSGLLRLSSAD